MELKGASSIADQEIWLLTKARELEQYLESEGAVKRAHNEVPGRDFAAVTGEDIEIALDIHSDMMLAVTVKAITLDIPLCVSSRGRYLGLVGEVATNASRRARYMEALAVSLNRIFMALGRAGSLEDAREFSRINLQVDLAELPERLRVLNAPLPAVIEQILLESGDTDPEDEDRL